MGALSPEAPPPEPPAVGRTDALPPKVIARARELLTVVRKGYDEFAAICYEWCTIQGWTHQAVADQFGCSRSTVTRAVERAVVVCGASRTTPALPGPPPAPPVLTPKQRAARDREAKRKAARRGNAIKPASPVGTAKQGDAIQPGLRMVVPSIGGTLEHTYKGSAGFMPEVLGYKTWADWCNAEIGPHTNSGPDGAHTTGAGMAVLRSFPFISDIADGVAESLYGVPLSDSQYEDVVEHAKSKLGEWFGEALRVKLAEEILPYNDAIVAAREAGTEVDPVVTGEAIQAGSDTSAAPTGERDIGGFDAEVIQALAVRYPAALWVARQIDDILSRFELTEEGRQSAALTVTTLFVERQIYAALGLIPDVVQWNDDSTNEAEAARFAPFDEALAG